MLRLRALSAAFLLPLVLGAAWLGGDYLLAFLALAAALGSWEFCGLASRMGARPLALAGMVGAVLFVVRVGQDEPSLASALLLLVAGLSLARLALASFGWRSLVDWGWTLSGMGYVGFLLSRLGALRLEPEGRDWVLLALLSTFALDTSSYAVGRLLGRHRLAPRMSPGKTWEGAAGGFLGVVGAMLALDTLLGLPPGPGAMIALGLLVGVAGQAGDLAESWLKRRAGVKDSGFLIPGHGGVLDRLDSLLLASIVIYYYEIWIAG